MFLLGVLSHHLLLSIMVELASIMAQLSCYLQCYDGNSVDWLIYDIDLHPPPLTFTVVLASPQFCLDVIGLVKDL
jgi:hypothetical protein